MADAHGVTLVTSKFLPMDSGGAEVQVHLLATYLAEQGRDVEVVTGAAVRPKDVAYRIVSHPALRPRPSIVYEPWWARRTAGKIRAAIDPSRIVHSFDVLSRGVVAELDLPRTVTTIQDISPICGTIDGLLTDGSICHGCTRSNLFQHERLRQSRGLQWLARVIRYWTACVVPYRRQLLDRYQAVTVLTQLPRDYLTLPQAIVIPDLVEVAVPRQTAPAHAPTIVSLGRLGPDKGTDLILQALTELPDFLAVFVGGGLKQTWQQRAQRLGVAERARWVGQVSFEEVPDWYAQGDVIVLASRGVEASSRTVLEGMSLGKAVVAPRFGGPAEMVDDGVTGVLFERGDARDLARAIKTAYQQRARLGGQAREVSRRYRPEDVGSKYLELYAQLTP